MKLLLTSAGVTNESINSALFELINKPPEETNVAFIPTAADVEPGNKDWFIGDINTFVSLGSWKQFDIVDIAAVDQKFWKPRLQDADVLYVSGGNEFFLMHHIQQSGLESFLQDWLETKVWVGVSAGSMVMGKRIQPKFSQLIYDEEIVAPFDNVTTFLEYVDFAIKPHMNSPHFPKASEEHLKEYASQIPGVFYGIDDQSAIKVVDGKVEVVTQGRCEVFNDIH